MSVYKAQRNPSKAEFLTTAKKLFIFTIKLSKKFPKSYKFNMYQDLYNLTRDISLSVFQANSYYVSKTMQEASRTQYRKNNLGCQSRAKDISPFYEKIIFT